MKLFILTLVIVLNTEFCYSQWENCVNAICPTMGNYTLSGKKWYKSDLKYYFANGTNDIPGEQEKTAFEAAFNTWSQVMPFDFTETLNLNEADIYIKYVSTGSEWSSTYAPITAIAGAWYPETNCQGVLLLNNWYYAFSLQENPQNAKDLQAVALHEIGHILGLCHSNNSSTVMYFNQQNPNKRSLHTYDIEGIKAIYEKVTIKNEFRNPNGTISNGGIINVEYSDYNTNDLPNNEKSFAFNKNSTRRFEAQDQSFQNLDRRFNPFELYNGGWRFGINTLIGTEAVINPNVSAGTYRARYRYKTNIGLNANTEFNGTISTGLTIGEIYQYDNGNIAAPLSYQPSGSSINYNFSGWTDDLTDTNPRIINPTENETYTALYKYPHHSNSAAAYSSNSQRKFVQTPDGVKHMVYESMNKVWYELSTDNGATWLLGNGGKPLSSADSKNPSMSIYNYQIGIVWQEQSGVGVGFKIRMAVFNESISPFFSTVADDPLPYSINANPVIAFGYSYANQGNVMVAWSGGVYDIVYEQRIMLRLGSASENGIVWEHHSFLWQTDANSINPTIIADYTDDISNPFNYHLAWEQVINTSNSKVNYCRLFYQNNNIQHSAIEEASLNSGYNKNYKPLLTLRKAFGFEYIYLSWIGYRLFASEGPGLEKSNFVQMGETRALVRYKLGANWSAIGVYGNSVASQSLNRGTTVISSQQVMGFAWSEYNGLSFVNKMMKFPVSQNIFTLNTTGKDLQVNNSVSFSDMFANSYQTVSSPFSFNLSQNFNSLNKENALMVYNGREGVVGRNDGQFYFALGDITVNGTNINFPQIPDSITISTLAELNHYLTSESFNVDNNSSLVYGVQYGITDTLSCISALEDEREVKFKVELFDPMSNDILGVFDNVTFNENNVIQYENIGYQVDLTGIGNRTLKLRLVVDYSPDFSFNLSDRYADESILAKNNLRTINYKGSLAVTEYALEQNYPNPFNPGTTIRYQLPQDGMVTLKVYDILGSEVATLVNEQKSAGKYEVNFDASRFASGVYIYKITSGSYVSSKKMLLVK